MKLSISKLQFDLQDTGLEHNKSRLDTATEELTDLAEKSGTHSDKFKRAYNRVENSLQQGKSLPDILQSAIEIRALALLLSSNLANKIKLTPDAFKKINQIRKKPSSLLIEAVYLHYLRFYDELRDISAVESWLLEEKKSRGQLTYELKHLLGGNGPKWLAENSHSEGRDFDEQIRLFNLDRYTAGRFLTVAKNIYYLDILRGLRPNEFNPILEEMQKRSVFESRYDDSSLLGHQILKILIEKAPVSGISEKWLNVILAIGGDPRIPKEHLKYRKWWSQIDHHLKIKVEGWLSKLDLALFLEAMENFSYQAGNNDLRRMYPARKHFMEGLLDKKLVTHTRLFLSKNAERYLRSNYKAEHLPYYSIVEGDRSIIFIQLGSVHMVEGSHNCKLWIYEHLDSSAVVFNYSMNRIAYWSLTSGLRDKMERLGIRHKADITHNPRNFNWQNKAIEALQELGVPLDSKDVLPPEDHKEYKRLYGA
jgi:hypothetical protein